MRRDEVEDAWRFISPVLESWEESEREIATYKPGSQGPGEADKLLHRDGHWWSEIG